MTASPAGSRCGKDVLADEQLAGLARPVLAERRLHAVHDGPVQVQADVGEMLAVLRVAQPFVGDAMAADERFPAVDHGQLAVVAVVQHPDGVERSLVEELHLAAHFAHAREHVLVEGLRALRVQHQAHADAGPGAVHERADHPCGERARLPEEGFEVDGLARGQDPRLEHVVEGTVLVDAHGVAGHRGAEREAREGRDQRVDAVVALHLQHGAAMAADRPDHEHQHGDQRGRQPGPEGGVHLVPLCELILPTGSVRNQLFARCP